MLSDAFFFDKFKYLCLTGKVNLDQDPVKAVLLSNTPPKDVSDTAKISELFICTPVDVPSFLIAYPSKMVVRDYTFKEPFKKTTAEGVFLYTDSYPILFVSLHGLDLYMIQELVLSYEHINNTIAEL